MLEIGTILTRDDGERFRLSGVDGGAWVAEPIEFGSPIRVGAHELATTFAVAEDTAPAEPDPQDGWTVLAAASRVAAAEAARLGGHQDAPTPEQVFAAAEVDK